MWSKTRLRPPLTVLNSRLPMTSLIETQPFTVSTFAEKREGTKTDILTGKRLDDYVKHIRGLLDMGVPIPVSVSRGICTETVLIPSHYRTHWTNWRSSSCRFASRNIIFLANAPSTTPAIATPS